MFAPTQPQVIQNPEMVRQIDFNKLEQLKEALKQIDAKKKEFQGEVLKIEELAAKALRHMRIPYVAIPGQDGWYLALEPKEDESSFKRERQIEFFSLLMRAIEEGRRPTVTEIVENLQAFLKKYSGRKLILKRVCNPKRNMSVDDMERWVQNGDEAKMS